MRRGVRSLKRLGHATFDIVYVSQGALCWLPNVDRWAQEAAGLVAPGGRLYLHDGHPLAWALADDSLTVEHTYFEESEPYVGDADHSYTDGDALSSIDASTSGTIPSARR